MKIPNCKIFLNAFYKIYFRQKEEHFYSSLRSDPRESGLYQTIGPAVPERSRIKKNNEREGIAITIFFILLRSLSSDWSLSMGRVVLLDVLVCLIYLYEALFGSV